jgi:shikimate dehydrogenase
MVRLGLIGYPLTHSFSKRYFSRKFEEEALSHHYTYENFELEVLDAFPSLWEDSALKGVNVTIPYKIKVMKYLDRLDPSAEKVGAVNVISRESGKLVGYNTDYFGFLTSLEDWLQTTDCSALILGTGGASRAVMAALDELQISYQAVSRNPLSGQLSYQELEAEIENYKLVINTTPLGTFPATEKKPDLPYHLLDQNYFLYDLIYNPEITAFMQAGKERGAKVINGLNMLHLQAEKAWQIWTKG